MATDTPKAQREDIRLVPQIEDHADGLFDALSDPRIYRYLDEDPPRSGDEIRARITRQRAGPPDRSEIWLNWSVFFGGRIVGFTQASVTPDQIATIAYVMSPDVWGRDVAFHAVTAMLGVLAADHHVTRVVADTETDNVASQRLLIRLGFTQTHVDGADVHYARAVMP